MKHFLLILPVFISFLSFAQTDTSTQTGIFQKITAEMAAFRADTSQPPQDKTTKKITELIHMGAIFNLAEAIEFKLSEDRSENKITEEERLKIHQFFKTGDGRRLLENAQVWIYRQYFTYGELRSLVRFYRSSAGKKLTGAFPHIMLKSMIAAEQIKDSQTW